jgi:hypothetical protein
MFNDNIGEPYGIKFEEEQSARPNPR